MKKLRNIFLMMCLFVPLAFAGCGSDETALSTPKIVEIKAGTIVFNKIRNAEYYTISINENELIVNPYHSAYAEIEGNTVRYDASKIFTVGDDYSVKIRANNSKNKSSFSTNYNYRHSGSIKQPTNLRFNSTSLSWDSVKNATYYTVKVITPHDKVVFDKNGDVITSITPSTIADADITEFHYNTNSFNFGSILNKAGKYRFYVCSVIADGTYYVESSFSDFVEYTHNVELQAPVNGKVYAVSGDLHMMTVVDPNSNALSICCKNYNRTVELNGSEKSVVKMGSNVFDINLSEFFSEFIDLGQLDFDNFENHSFTTKSMYLDEDAQEIFYTDSAVSSTAMFTKTTALSTPTIDIKENTNGSYVVNWSSKEQNLIGGYKLIVATPTGVKEYQFDYTITKMTMPEDFIAAAVQTIGKGQYTSSPFTDFVYAIPSKDEQKITTTVNGTRISWDSVPETYSILLIDSNYAVTNNSSYTLTESDFTVNGATARHYLIKEGCRYSSNKTTFEKYGALPKPTFKASQGFKSTNIYELTFTGCENAIGYYVHIKGAGSKDFTRLDTLYTSTRIDLSEYIITAGNYTTYQVKVQAVADVNDIYEDSELSNIASVSHSQVLDTPEFYTNNGVVSPVLKQTSADTTKYLLRFYGVENAGSYEVMVNFNKITVEAKPNTELYSVDISNYLTAADNYEIKVKALPSSSASDISESEYNTTHYLLSKQLGMVENIYITENDGSYALTFDPVDNADSYLVRIVKENDGGYVDYLTSIGLSNYVTIRNSLDITKYVQNKGVYYFYITALAPTSNSYYADGIESINYGTLSKLETLTMPSEIAYDNASKNTYLLTWNGSTNADFYRIKLTTPYGDVHEFNSYVNSVNINQYMTIQGNYSVSIYSMVNATGENAKEHASSSATTFSWRYLYRNEHDFMRYSISMYGSNYNFIIDTENDSNASNDSISVNNLKNLLWNHYVFGTGAEGLTVMLKHNDSTLKEKIVELSIKATQLNLYNFTGSNDLQTIINYYDHIDITTGDTTWYNMLKTESLENNLALFKYLCERLLEVYPDLNVLDDFRADTVSSEDDATIFNLKYENALNTTKIDTPTNAQALTNYATTYKYIDLTARKSSTGSFAIDTRGEMFVTTTEQLLHAVQHNMKPKFIGDSSTAETVYNNAKIVLSAIVTKNMTELEKVTAIFDWLEANFDLTYYNNQSLYISGAVEKENVATYGQYKNYYLEGIFEDITMNSDGDLIIGSNLATSWSYSKAFALLCAIEGIDAKVVYGSYEFNDTHTGETAVADHVWNKVYLSTTTTTEARSSENKEWYVVDLTFSDNRIYFADLTLGYGISSHSHFLVTDAFVQENSYLDVQLEEKTYLISQKYQSNLVCTSAYDYYKNSSFGLTYYQLDKTILDFDDGSVKGFNYSKLYTPEPQDATEETQLYQRYAKTLGYGSLESYLLNAVIYAEYMADQNPTGRSVFEFTFKKSDNGNSYNFDTSELFERFEIDTTKYNIQLKLLPELSNQFYTIVNPSSGTATLIFIVEKTA